MNMRVIGMDISKGVATCVMLEELPENLSEFARSKEFVYWHIKPCTADLEAIAALEPDLIAFEPSGGKYEAAFKHFFRKRGLKFRQVAGRRLARFRADAGLTKDDHFDGLAIAAYAMERGHEPGAFIPETTPEIENLRQIWLQRHSLVRQRNGLINRLRQQLAAEFPEAMEFESGREWGESSNCLVQWLNGQGEGNRHVTKWENRYSGGSRRVKGQVIEQPPTCGAGLSSYTKLVAQQLLENEQAMAAIEDAIDAVLAKEDYAPYVKAMDAIGFSPSIKAVWLTRIYPFSKFMGPDGERVTKRLSSNGRWCTHNHSLGQFKAALGAAVDLSRSGTGGGIAPTQKREVVRRGSKKKTEKTSMGCKYCRVTFWQWGLVRIETGRATGEIAEKLIEKRNTWKAADKNVFQRSGLLHGYACKLLYRELKKNLV